MALQYSIEGNGTIKLTDADFVAEGGEGKIYAQGSQVFKIYTDVNKMVPVAKIRELAQLNHQYIIRPQVLVLDKKNNPVGFTMQRVPNALPLPRLFTNDFRNRNRITDDNILALIEKMQETVSFIHHHHCLMVDGNELNYLVDDTTYQIPYFIDVDSYQTPNFPATALMPSIRDYHSKNFSPLSDWFSFAIVICQLLIGIHPYKGKHPNFNKHDLQGRMQANISIFNKEVSLPAATRDFGVIPKPLYEWFIRLFEKGERLLPPAVAGKMSTLPASPQGILSGSYFTVSLLREFNEPIHAHCTYRGIHTVLAGRKTLFVDTNEMLLPDVDMVIVYAPETFVPLGASIRGGLLYIENLQIKQPLTVTIKANRLFTANNTLYVVQQDQLIAVKIINRNNVLLVSSGKSWRIMPHSHQVLDGLLYQNVLGKPYLVIPYSEEACMINPIPELAGYRIISGRHDKGVVMLIGHKQGQYDQLILRFDERYRKYTVQIIENKDILDNNFVTLDNDMVIHIPQDGELVIFHRYTDARRTIVDPQIYTTMRLSHKGNTVLCYTDNKLYNIEMKGN